MISSPARAPAPIAARDGPSPRAVLRVVAVVVMSTATLYLLYLVRVGAVTLFSDFPTVTIILAVFAIAYQQFENYVVQPRIQSRAAELDPFIVVVAALFSGALLGVLGALLAIPTAAVIQVAAREYLSYRRDAQRELKGESVPDPLAAD